MLTCGVHSFKSIMATVLSHFGAGWVDTTREHSEQSRKGAKVRIPIAEGDLEHETQDLATQTPLVQLLLSPQEVAGRLPDEASLIIIDDFDRVGAGVRALFAELIKKLSDNERPATLLLVGIGTNVDELLAAHESIGRNIAQIAVPRLPDEELRNIVSMGMAELGISINQGAIDQIVEDSAHLLYSTHSLCEGAVLGLLNRVTATTRPELRIRRAEIPVLLEGHGRD